MADKQRRIRIKCKCGDIVLPNRWAVHTQISQNRGLEHEMQEFIDLDSEEVCKNYDEAKEKWGINLRKLQQNPTDTSTTKIPTKVANYEDDEEIYTHILGQIPYTTVLIHPYLYEMFRQAMVIFPEEFPIDDEVSFSRFLLKIGLGYRINTSETIPWNDAMAQSIVKFLNIGGAKENDNQEEGAVQ